MNTLFSLLPRLRWSIGLVVLFVPALAQAANGDFTWTSLPASIVKGQSYTITVACAGASTTLLYKNGGTSSIAGGGSSVTYTATETAGTSVSFYATGVVIGQSGQTNFTSTPKTIPIVAAPVPPTLTWTVTPASPVANVAFTVAVSTSAGTRVDLYRGADPAVAGTGTTSASCSTTITTGGTVTFKAIVTSASGSTYTETKSVTVAGPPTIPTDNGFKWNYPTVVFRGQPYTVSVQADTAVYPNGFNTLLMYKTGSTSSVAGTKDANGWVNYPTTSYANGTEQYYAKGNMGTPDWYTSNTHSLTVVDPPTFSWSVVPATPVAGVPYTVTVTCTTSDSMKLYRGATQVGTGTTSISYSTTDGAPQTVAYRAEVAGIYGLFSETLNVGIQAPPPPPPLPPPLPPAADLVATIPGDFSVDNKGSANYSLPLALPPGRGGVGPKVSLSYSSGGGNGPLGIGFSLSTGFPQSITRGRTILARDGVTRGVLFDNSKDKFYLDGKRLICVSGTYGAPSSVYRTEVDSFVTITTTGTGGNIETFVVADKSGSKMTFGKTTDSSDAYQPGIFNGAIDSFAYTYALKCVEDAVGNRIDFTYVDSAANGEYVLSRIDYTANKLATPAVDAQNKIEFDYSSDRPDKSFSYVSGRRFAKEKRLDVVRASTGGVEYVKYVLSYGQSAESGRTQLRKIWLQTRESATDSWKSSPDTQFEWSQYNLGVIANKSQQLPEPAKNEWGYRESAWGDFNGDGKEDYAIIVNGGITVYTATGKQDAANQFTSSVWMALPSGFVAGHTTLIALDFTGDGKKDILLGRNTDRGGGGSGGGTLAVIPCRSTGSSFVASSIVELATTTRTWFTVDPRNTYNDLGYFLRSVGGGVFSRFIPGDYDGNGQEDVLVQAYDGYRYLLKYNLATNQLDVGPAMNPGAPGKSPSVAVWTTGWLGSGVLPIEYHWDITYPLDQRPMPCDLNGDGITDYVWEDKTNTVSFEVTGGHASNREWFASVSDGLGGASPVESKLYYGIGSSSTGNASVPDSVDSVENYTQLFFPADFNGDGITDFLVRNRGTNGWDLRIGTGRVDASSFPITEDHPGALGRTFSANGEILHTAARFMPKLTWDANFQNGVNMSELQYRSALARIQADSSSNTTVMDINQDGLADLVWYVEYKKFNTDPKDARDTAASAANCGWWIAYSTGAGFREPQKLSGGVWNNLGNWPHGFNGYDMASASIATPDLNGDGLADWVISGSNFNGDDLTFYAYNAGNFGDLVTTVYDGLRRKTTVLYKGAKDDSVYTPGAAVTFPLRELRASTPVVAELYKDVGSTTAADSSHFSYQYSGNRLDLSGRGALGFHSFVTIDRQTNLFKYQFLAQSFPMTGLTAREQTYRYWESTDHTSVYFRSVNSHDNTVVFDEVDNGATDVTARYATVYPFISQAVESRWEDSTTESHFGPWSKAGGPESKPELLFAKALPPGAHITVSAKSWFDNQSLTDEPPTTIPGGKFYASDRTTGWTLDGANSVYGSNSYQISGLGLPRQITYGNLRRLKTNFSDGFTEQVDTNYYTPAEVGGYTGLVKDVTTTVAATGYTLPADTTAPIKRYAYWKKGGTTWTPLVETETVDATDDKLDLTTTTARDSLGRVTSTTVTGYNNPGTEGATVIGTLDADDTKAKHVGSFTTSSVSAFDPKWDAPATSKNAYGHTTKSEYHSLLGLPITVTDDSNSPASGPKASVTTAYDALGRKVLVTDVLKGLSTTTAYAWCSATATDWKKTQSVSLPSGDTFSGVGQSDIESGRITGVSAIAASSVYAVRTTATVQPPVTAYFDRLGRTIRTVKEGFAGQTTVTDTVYNTLGQTIATSLPYASGTAAASILWTKTTYDPLGRVATVTAPNGTTTTNTYQGRCTTVAVKASDRTDTQSNTTYVDAKGRTIKVWNSDNSPGTIDLKTGGSTTASLEYKLDGFGRMRATVLRGQTQQVTAKYDALGRQTELVDPDKGTWTYINNALGQVVVQTDAKSNVTRSTFDRLGRPLSRRTSEAAGPIENASWYYYDFAASDTLHLVAHTVGSTDQGWIGAPQREMAQTTGAPGYGDPGTASIHYYDTLGRPAISLNQADGKYFYTCAQYDAYSRPASMRYFWRPAGHEEYRKPDGTIAPSDTPYYWNDWGYTYTYDGTGASSESYLLKIQDSASTPRTWWEADATAGYDYLDRPVKVRKGGSAGDPRGAGLWTSRTYRTTDGLLTGIATGPTQGSTAIQNLTFDYDGLGNLVGRGGDPARSESFTYDTLNRLTSNGIAYADNGNITGKKGVDGSASGTYTYSTTKPHAVTAAFGYTYDYDLNGNMVTRIGGGHTWSTKWAGFDKPRWLIDTIGTVAKGEEFTYNANRSRVVHLSIDAVAGSGATATPNHYSRKKVYGMGPQLEADYANTAGVGQTAAWKLDKIRIYVPGPEGIIGTMEFNPRASFDKAEAALVYHYDHLGSIERITPYGSTSTAYVLDGAGKPSRYSYDAWGQRRNADTWSGKPTTTADGGSDDATPRGFTGHEMLDDIGLVHMNGRIYDALLGRFLSADLIVQNPGSLQSFNRYSYCGNNPLSFTDPSGFAASPQLNKEFKEWLEKAVKSSPEIAKAVATLIKNGITGLSFQKTASDAAGARSAQAQAAPTPATKQNDGVSTPDANGRVQSSSNASPPAEGSAAEKGTPAASTPGQGNGDTDTAKPQYKDPTWADFQGPVPSESGADEVAAIASHFDVSGVKPQYKKLENGNYEAYFDEDTLTVRAYHSPDLSWKKPGTDSMKGADQILAHEKTHFHITVKFAAELKAKLTELRVERVSWRDAGKELMRQAQNEVRNVENDKSNEQRKYDFETGHGTKRNRQADYENRYNEFEIK